MKFSRRGNAQEAVSVQSGKKNDREAIIDDNLKRVFDEALDEGIPDRFKDLLEQLKQQDTDKGSSQ